MKIVTKCDIKTAWPLITEEMLNDDEDGNSRVLSFTVNFDRELMIFFSKKEFIFVPCSNDTLTYFKVKIIKNSPEDKYIPNSRDNTWFYKEKDESVSLFFLDYKFASSFVSNLMSYHREFQSRPQPKAS